MKNNKDYQKHIEKLICFYLNDVEYSKLEYSVYKAGEVRRLVKEMVLSWPNMGNDGEDIYDQQVCHKYYYHTPKAERLVNEMINEGKSFSKIYRDKSIHKEHNHPKTLSIKSILNLAYKKRNNNEKITPDEVHDLLHELQIVIVSREEEELLRKNGYQSKGSFIERLNFIGLSEKDLRYISVDK